MAMGACSCRQATLGDARAILALLLDRAAEIPLLVDTLEREEALYALIRGCARSGETWVACEDGDVIVGVALAERAEHGRHYAEHEVIELHCAAARAAGGAEIVVAALIDKVLGGMVPVVATVSPENRTGLGELLRRKGFSAMSGAGGEHRSRWQPGN